MGITHVVRGSEYLSSAPKYNLLYEGLGWDVPSYVHCSPVMRDAHNKMSKRHGDPSYEDLVAQGFLTEAIVNYVALLGWAPGGEREIFSINELAEAFEPRFMSEEIDGERHEYADTLWIPSATDVFGAGDWWNEEPDSVQLEIFKRERDRVKEVAGETWSWWLRSPRAGYSYYFVYVYTDGTVDNNDAFCSLGFAPGFDL